MPYYSYFLYGRFKCDLGYVKPKIFKMDSRGFRSLCPHQLIIQSQVGPVSVLDNLVILCALCVQHGIAVWQHYKR